MFTIPLGGHVFFSQLQGHGVNRRLHYNGVCTDSLFSHSRFRFLLISFEVFTTTFGAFRGCLRPSIWGQSFKEGRAMGASVYNGVLLIRCMGSSAGSVGVWSSESRRRRCVSATFSLILADLMDGTTMYDHGRGQPPAGNSEL